MNFLDDFLEMYFFLKGLSCILLSMRTLLRLLPENMRVCVISKFITKVVRPTDAVQLILEKRVHHTVWILPLLGKGQSISFQGFHRAMGWVHDCI